ncbi:hypothetical protein OAF45_02415 [Candidatus Latescibacteria bacterium]|nr:hypothetical protein [Candidatus Latescibacterota bacterium]
MTVDERFEQLERKTQRLEQRNKRLTVALTMTVVAMAAVVTMAATGDKDGDFDVVKAKKLYVDEVNVYDDIVIKNRDGWPVILLGYDSAGSGTMYMQSGEKKALIDLHSNDNGALIEVFNKTREAIVTMKADEYGNGVVGAWNRKGKGRTLKPGP